MLIYSKTGIVPESVVFIPSGGAQQFISVEDFKTIPEGQQAVDFINEVQAQTRNPWVAQELHQQLKR